MYSFKKCLISAFIVLNILGMARMHLPMESKYISTLYAPIDNYLSFFSISQDWMMFAPDPSKEDHFITAKIEFEDGPSTAYEFEYRPEPNILHTYLRGERFRKITTEAIRKNENEFMWRDMAKFALRKVRDRNFSKLPAKVYLFRHWATTPDMQSSFVPHNYLKTNYSSHHFYTYEVM